MSTNNQIAAAHPANTNIVKHFYELASLYNKIGDKRRNGTFARIAGALKAVEHEITEEFDVTTIHGIGASTALEIDQLRKTGTSERKESLLSDPAVISVKKEMPLPDQVAEALAVHSGANEQALKVGIIMTAAVNGLSSLEKYKENVSKFDQHIQDAGLEVVLDKLIKS